MLHELIGLANVFIHVSMGKVGALAEACVLEFICFAMFNTFGLCVHPRKQRLHVLLHILEYAISLESNYWSVYQVQ